MKALCAFKFKGWKPQGFVPIFPDVYSASSFSPALLVCPIILCCMFSLSLLPFLSFPFSVECSVTLCPCLSVSVSLSPPFSLSFHVPALIQRTFTEMWEKWDRLIQKLNTHFDQLRFTSSSQTISLLRLHTFRAIPPRPEISLLRRHLVYESDTGQPLIRGQPGVKTAASKVFLKVRKRGRGGGSHTEQCKACRENVVKFQCSPRDSLAQAFRYG